MKKYFSRIDEAQPGERLQLCMPRFRIADLFNKRTLRNWV
jgi:hypothetical protein